MKFDISCTAIKKNVQHGFTLVEIIIVMAITGIILSLTYINVGGLVPKANLRGAVDTLVSDISVQQHRSMMGNYQTGNPSSRGIFFEEDQYTFFSGTAYNPSDSNNFSVVFPDGIRIIESSFPNDQIVFQQASGEVVGFVDGQNTITVENTATRESIIITLNRLGVVVSDL